MIAGLSGSPGVDEVADVLAAHGLALRGGFNFSSEDAAPPGTRGEPARSVLLVGNAGAAHWPHFHEWRSRQRQDIENPLDTWCREVIGAVATRFGARAVSPSDKPYLPFQQWAMRAEGLKPSPLGILMHPEYGLWHAYRGALLLDVVLDLPKASAPHLCDACPDKPCLTACPVRAHSISGFDYQGCLGHVRSAAGGACMTGGCLDRNACPHGAGYHYPADMQAFHMRAFART
jgi:ferredoxin